MERTIDLKLIDWKNKTFRKPLIIRGARQVGKTFSISQFGETCFESLIKLDFERNRSIHKIFDHDLSVKKIIQDIEIFSEKKIAPGKTLLFFDEIQECERAILSLRYFHEEMPDLHVIAAGSMLEFALGKISFPVGRVSFEWLQPMTFYEFLNASGKKILAGQLPCISSFKPVNEFVHQKIIDQLKIYFLTGGMPEAINRYCYTGSVSDSFAVHEEIFQAYLQSLIKYYRRADIDSLDHIMRTAPTFVGSQIKYTSLDPDRRIEKTKTSLQILEKALILQIIRSSNANSLPLSVGASAKKIKPLFLDIGLMQYNSGVSAKDVIEAKDLSHVYQGALAEQFVGQEMVAAGGSENQKMYYWARDKKSSSAEIDYLYVNNGNIFPIEVKSGPKGKLKSLHLFLVEHPGITTGYVMSPIAFEKQRIDNIVFIPIYTRFI
ncbi:MAG: AAA family ATPase [Pseudomonadota bacterium]